MKIAIIICIILYILLSVGIIFFQSVEDKLKHNYLVQRILQGVTEGEKLEYNKKKRHLEIVLYTLYSLLALVTAFGLILILEITPILGL